MHKRGPGPWVKLKRRLAATEKQPKSLPLRTSADPPSYVERNVTIFSIFLLLLHCFSFSFVAWHRSQNMRSLEGSILIGRSYPICSQRFFYTGHAVYNCCIQSGAHYYYVSQRVNGQPFVAREMTSAWAIPLRSILPDAQVHIT